MASLKKVEMKENKNTLSNNLTKTNSSKSKQPHICGNTKYQVGYKRSALTKTSATPR